MNAGKIKTFRNYYHFHHLEPVLENEIGYDVTHRAFIENKLILVPVFYRKIQ